MFNWLVYLVVIFIFVFVIVIHLVFRVIKFTIASIFLFIALIAIIYVFRHYLGIDLISEIALAIYEGRVPEAHLEGHVMALIRRAFKTDHNPWGDVSLDTVIPGTDLLRINIVSEGLWA